MFSHTCQTKNRSEHDLNGGGEGGRKQRAESRKQEGPGFRRQGSGFRD